MPGASHAPNDWPAEPCSAKRIVPVGRPRGPWRLRDLVREQAADGAVRRCALANSPVTGRPTRARAAPPRSAASRARRPSGDACAFVRRSGVPGRRRRNAAGSRERSMPRACQCSIASSASSRSTRPTRSSNRAIPSCAMIRRASSATKKKKLTTCSGLPLKRARSSGSCVAMPTGHVFRWQARIITQPVAISGAVAKPISSAPSSAAMTTSRPVFSWPSVCTQIARAQVVQHERLLRLGEADLPRDAGVQDRRDRRGAGAAVVARDQHVVGVRLRDAGGDGADADLGDELHRDARGRVRAAQVVDQLLQILDRVDVVVRRRRDQARRPASSGARRRCSGRPCAPAAGRPRRASRPAPS